MKEEIKELQEKKEATEEIINVYFATSQAFTKKYREYFDASNRINKESREFYENNNVEYSDNFEL